VRKIAVPFACALLLAGPFCFAPVSDSDSGWHVAVGRLILHAGIPRTNALSWKWGDHPWYPTSWLYDVLCAALGTALGLQLLTFALLSLALLALAFACESAWIVPAVALLLVPRLVPRLTSRPGLCSPPCSPWRRGERASGPSAWPSSR